MCGDGRNRVQRVASTTTPSIPNTARPKNLMEFDCNHNGRRRSDYYLSTWSAPIVLFFLECSLYYWDRFDAVEAPPIVTVARQWGQGNVTISDSDSSVSYSFDFSCSSSFGLPALAAAVAPAATAAPPPHMPVTKVPVAPILWRLAKADPVATLPMEACHAAAAEFATIPQDRAPQFKAK